MQTERNQQKQPSIEVLPIESYHHGIAVRSRQQRNQFSPRGFADGLYDFWNKSQISGYAEDPFGMPNRPNEAALMHNLWEYQTSAYPATDPDIKIVMPHR